MNRGQPLPLLRALAPYAVLWIVYAVLIVVGAVYGVIADRDRDRRGAEKDLANLSRLMQVHALRTLDSIDRTLSLARAVQEGHINGTTLQGLFDALRLGDDGPRRVSVFDRRGQFVTSSDPEAALAKLSLAGRDYFRAAREGNTQELTVAPPLAGQITGRVLVPVFKRLTSASGEFDGVVLSMLDPIRLVDVYRGVDLGDEGFLGVAQREGQIIARSGAAIAAPSVTAAPPVLPRTLLIDDPARPAIGTAEIAGTSYLLAAQRVRGTELFVFVAQPERDILLGNRRFSYVVAVLAVLALAVLALPVGFAARRSLRVLREREALEVRSRIDPLTQTQTRAALEDRLRVCLNTLARDGEPFALAFIDTDNFKTVNDTRGHAEGDRALARIAAILQASVRKSDLVARMGGDEFAVLLPAGAPAATQRVFAQVIEMLRVLVRREGWPISFSIGVVTFRAPPSSVTEAIAIADRIMYAVKQTTKDSVSFATLDHHGLNVDAGGPEQQEGREHHVATPGSTG
jgi:diguanylate cyclase (GGDEF)-like protein